jgi:serine phosphatase RsbU (regulator of sigma subunit)
MSFETDQIKNLNEIILQINSSLDLSRIMDLIYQNIRQKMPVSFFIISSYSENDDTLKIEYCVKNDRIVKEEFKTKSNNPNSLTAHTISSKKEIIIHDLSIDYSNYLSGNPQLHGKEDLWCESVLMFPLIVQNDVIGLFSVQHETKNCYSDEDIRLLRILTPFIGLALNNANIYNSLSEKNKDITDSINYARRIQQAKLPSRKEIQVELPNSFILFKPKDIVSGDFYYFHKNENSVFIASADCTGHGVPGAFMSIIGIEKLNDALKLSTDTSEILSHLNKGVKISLRQTDREESTRDGMDIALCSVDKKTRVVKYAGANRPLWIIRNGQTELEEIKATKNAIGGLTEDDQHFETHEIILQKGDTFYIFTDGYADQFNGQNGKKLYTKKFKEILVNIQSKTMQEQETYLDNFIENWKAGKPQVDDILVIGVQL